MAQSARINHIRLLSHELATARSTTHAVRVAEQLEKTSKQLASISEINPSNEPFIMELQTVEKNTNTWRALSSIVALFGYLSVIYLMIIAGYGAALGLIVLFSAIIPIFLLGMSKTSPMLSMVNRRWLTALIVAIVGFSLESMVLAIVVLVPRQ
jgi:hypothetical protein